MGPKQLPNNNQSQSGFYGGGKNNDDSIRNFKPPMPNFAKKQLPPTPIKNNMNKSENNGYGMMMAPPSRAKRQKFKEKKSKPKSVWGVNENSGDDMDEDEYKKNKVLGLYNKRKSQINDMVSDE